MLDRWANKLVFFHIFISFQPYKRDNDLNWQVSKPDTFQGGAPVSFLRKWHGPAAWGYAIAAATALSSRFCFSDPETYAGSLVRNGGWMSFDSLKLVEMAADFTSVIFTNIIFTNITIYSIFTIYLFIADVSKKLSPGRVYRLSKWSPVTRKAGDLRPSPADHKWVGWLYHITIKRPVYHHIWVCLKIVYPYTQWFCWSLSLLNGYNWGYTLFSDKPIW